VSPSQARYAVGVWQRLLERSLYPLALEAAQLPTTTAPAQILARRHDPIPCYELAAELECEGLLLYRATLAAARHCDTSAARAASEAIVELAMAAAHELAVVRDLLAMVPVGTGLPMDWLQREDAAERAFERFARLDPAVEQTLRAEGLTQEDVALAD